MRPVRRQDVLDYVTYNEQRDTIRASALAAKELRRYQLGDYLCFLFENTETVRYQVQEMMLTEQIVREVDIQHEITTYNELIGGPGELRCTLLIGITDEAARDRLLTAWMGLNENLYLRLDDGRIVRATWDERQVGDDRLSSVQYLNFVVGDSHPVAVGCDREDAALRGEEPLTLDQQKALRTDLANS